MFWAYIIQKFILFTSYALSPLLIGFMAIRPLRSVGSRYLMHIVGVLLWPLGWAVAALITQGILDFMTDPSSRFIDPTASDLLAASDGWRRRGRVLDCVQHHRRADRHSEGSRLRRTRGWPTHRPARSAVSFRPPPRPQAQPPSRPRPAFRSSRLARRAWLPSSAHSQAPPDTAAPGQSSSLALAFRRAPLAAVPATTSPATNPFANSSPRPKAITTDPLWKPLN